MKILVVDVRNIFIRLLNVHEGKLDYERLSQEYAHYDFRRAYHIRSGTSVKFENLLSRLGFDIRVDTNQKRDWNVEIAVDTFSMIDRITEITLCTSCVQLAPLITALRGRGIRVRVLSCRAPELLRKSPDQYFEIPVEWLGAQNDSSNK